MSYSDEWAGKPAQSERFAGFCGCGLTRVPMVFLVSAGKEQ